MITDNERMMQLNVWDLTTGKIIAEHAVSGRPLSGIVSPDSSRLLIGLANGMIELRTADSLEKLRTLKTNSSRIGQVLFSPDGKRLVAGGSNGMVHLFATDDWREVATLAAAADAPSQGDTAVRRLTFSKNGQALAAYLGDGRLRVWSW